MVEIVAIFVVWIVVSVPVSLLVARFLAGRRGIRRTAQSVQHTGTAKPAVAVSPVEAVVKHV